MDSWLWMAAEMPLLAHGGEHGGLQLPPLHPILVNFTAALVPASVVSDLLGRYFRRESFFAAGFWTIVFAGVVTPLTAVAGWLWLAQMGDMGHREMVVHRALGTCLALAVGALALWRSRAHLAGRPPGAAYLVGAAVILAAVAFQGYLGGRMSFEEHASAMAASAGAHEGHAPATAGSTGGHERHASGTAPSTGQHEGHGAPSTAAGGRTEGHEHPLHAEGTVTSRPADGIAVATPTGDVVDAGLAPKDPGVPLRQDLGHYFPLRAALAADRLDEAKEHARSLARSRTEPIARPAGAFAEAADLEGARRVFGELSRGIIDAVQAAGNEKVDVGRVRIFECPMAKPFGRWVQADDDMGNPYFGQKMLKCGKKVAEIGGAGAPNQGGAEPGGSAEGHGGHH